MSASPLETIPSCPCAICEIITPIPEFSTPPSVIGNNELIKILIRENKELKARIDQQDKKLRQQDETLQEYGERICKLEGLTEQFREPYSEYQ